MSDFNRGHLIMSGIGFALMAIGGAALWIANNYGDEADAPKPKREAV